MKKPNLLNLLLTTTIVVLLFYIRSSAEKNPEPSPFLQPGTETCQYSRAQGFTTAVQATNAEVRVLASNYAAFASGRGDGILGGVISKAALDSIFCSGNYNALSYQLAMDPSGKAGPANSVFVVITGVNITNDNNRGPVVSSQSPFNYLPNLWCPPHCANFE